MPLFRPFDALFPVPNISVLPALVSAGGRLWPGPLRHPEEADEKRAFPALRWQ